MQLQQRNAVVAATWIMVAGFIGLVGNVTSIGGAAAVLGVGLVPPLIMMLHTSTVRAAVLRTYP
jgi:hypothetical protein